MFSGIGGFEKGIAQATNNMWKCIGYSEINKYAIQIYEKHFKEHKNYGNATRINTKELPEFDMLVGGFPCQAFSIAGKRRGFDDSRGTLFFEVARILRDKRPKYFLLENVKGLLSHEDGKTIKTILRVLSDLGYNIEWKIFNSKNYGVAQNRERIFIFGIRKECRRKILFKKRISTKTIPTKKLREQISNCLRTNYSNAKSNETYVLQEITKGNSQGMRVYDTEGISTTIASQAGGLGAKTGLYAMRGRKKTQQLEKRKDKNTNSLTSVQKDNLYLYNNTIRSLTPLECERLQGFQDNWTSGISDTQRYKCLGNAVTVNVIEYIIRGFKKKYEYMGRNSKNV